MQNFYIKNSLKRENIPEILRELEKIDYTESLTIIIDSTGGDTFIFDIIYRRLIKHRDYTIEVYKAMSNALVILDKLSLKAQSIYIHELTEFMAHICYISVYYGDGGKIKEVFDKNLIKMMDKYKPYKFNFLTQEEQRKYEEGEDIYIISDRMIEYYNC